MKKFITIGLGNFGLSIAKTLEENGCEVLGIDPSEHVVEKAKAFISHAVIGDASDKDVLVSLKIRDFDGAIVSLGQEIEPSILISLYLKEIGVKKIIVRAISDDHGKILSLLGVDEVIFPERDMAIRMANRLSLKNALDFLPLGEDYGIIEIFPPKSFIGKSLKDLQITSKFNCQVIAIKSLADKKNTGFATKFSSIKIPPRADDIISENSGIIIIGDYKNIEKIQALK